MKGIRDEISLVAAVLAIGIVNKDFGCHVGVRYERAVAEQTYAAVLHVVAPWFCER
jgi:hypothetical protein